MISVFTPTYNRLNLLNRLYSSLLEQTDKDFEWIIVDDGSSDGTAEKVREWISQKEIVIKYKYQENSGKHIAFNNGIDLAVGELYFCVDSDDFLPCNSIENINNSLSNLTNSTTIGIVALKSDTEGNMLSDEMPTETDYSTTYDLTNKYHSYGEKAIIYKTDILKENRFPVIENEKFMGECVLYDFLDSIGKMYLLNKVITICEYQKDGLTNNFLRTMVKNPIGFKIYHKQRIDLASAFKERMGYAIRYNAFKFMSDDTHYNYRGRHSTLVKSTIPLGWLLKPYYSFKK